jgi:branched-chain amino acid transport system permease protein
MAFSSLLIGALMIGSIYALVALGLSLIYKASNLMSFMQGNVFMMGGFWGLTFYNNLSFPFYIALPIIAIIMFAFGFVVERYIVRKLLNAGTIMIYVVLATIALNVILKNAAMFLWGTRQYYFKPIFAEEYFKVGSITVPKTLLLALGLATLFMLALHLFMTKTKFGTGMRAAAQDNLAASSMGINVSLTTGVTWGIACALAAIGGLLYSPVYSVSMSIGNAVSFKGFAGAVIGGFGNMYGAIVGGLLVGIMETFLAAYVSASFKDIVSYALIMLVLFFRPTGLFKSEVLS